MRIPSYNGHPIEANADDVELAILLFKDGLNRIEVAKQIKMATGLSVAVAIAAYAEKKFNEVVER